MEAVKRWFVHDWQTLDNKIKSSIVEGVSVFLAMFDMPDVAKVFCPAAPHISDDPQAIILQAQLRRLKAEQDAEAEKAEAEAAGGAKPGASEAGADEAGAKKPQAAEIRYTWGGVTKKVQKPKAAGAGEGKPEPVKAAQPDPVKAAEAEWVVVEPEPVKAAEAEWVVTEPEPHDKTPDPATESNQAATFLRPAAYRRHSPDHAPPTAAL